MKLQILAACAALASLSAGSALAGDPITAKLQAPVAAKVKLIAGGAMFTCQDDTCVAPAPTSSTFAMSTCRTIADKVGPVAAFTGLKTLSEDKLATCNAKAVAKSDEATRLAKQ
ncbi:hypothetical protein [uncultured Phenylobacterium sp.]|uniref:CC_3452 family protein n=1 Tax=uncultured Phenylobacterium sp. TaxID=349273 RepID=UPI0025E3ACF6|nr:hypothetical protein [uncultured Phenylobacterium sp.]